MVLTWELNVSFRNSINNIKGIFKHNSFKNVNKVFNLETSETVYYFGKVENACFLHVGLFHGITNKPKAIITLEIKASNNTNLQVVKHDPTLLCTAYKKNRFYLFTRRESENTKK
jgi:peptidylprolyl isomerase domain and WD repeat-containing protein 1